MVASALETLNTYAPRFEIEIDNAKLGQVISKAIIDVKIDEKIEEGAHLTLTVHDDFDFTSQEFKFLDSPLFDVGKEIAIKIGYGNDLYTLFMGSIVRIEPSFFSGETPTFTVEGQDLSYNYFKRRTPERTFVDMRYSEMAQMIASEAGLQSNVDEMERYEKSKTKDNNKTYYKFLSEIAEEIGATFYIDRKTLYFIKPVDNKKEILTLELGKDIISFRPNMNTTNLVTEVEVRYTNPNDPAAPFIGIARAGDENNLVSGTKAGSKIAQEKVGTIKKVITDIQVYSAEHAHAVALAELHKANYTLIEGSGECIGIPQMRPGVAIALNKIGNRFSGIYNVTGTTHTINDSGYRTQFSVKKTSIKSD